MEEEKPKKRGFTGFAVNNDTAEPFARAVGKFLVNFGSIEMSARLWLHAVASDDHLILKLEHLRLAQRIHLIRELAKEGRVPAHYVAEVDALWGRAAELSGLRNQVSHNPLVFGWHGEERDSPPDYVGIPDRRKGSKKPFILLDELNAATDAIVDIVQSLHRITVAIEAGPGWPAHPSPDQGGSAT